MSIKLETTKKIEILVLACLWCLHLGTEKSTWNSVNLENYI